MRRIGSRRTSHGERLRDSILSSAPVIRRALPVERAEVVATVTAAFAEDPAWGFLMSEHYERLAPQFAGALFDLRVVCGNVWVSDDLATVAMWDSPRGEYDPPRRARDVWASYRAVAGEQAYERLIAYNDALAAASPADPYWYLGVLATCPARQGEGLASAVLTPVLSEADRSGMACCLETSTEANRRFYERRGFIEPTAVALAAGPTTWWLRRPPSS
jgi:GNAT superfamily N-acetyltransferase